MKKLFTFTKTFLVTAGLCVGMNAWADAINATLDHTASSSRNGSNTITTTVDQEYEHYNNTKAAAWGGWAYAQFSYTIPEGHSIASAILTWNTKIGGNSGTRNNDIYYVTAGTTIDYANLTSTTNLNLGGTLIKTEIVAGPTSRTQVVTDVTDAVTAIAASQDYIIFKWTNNAAGADLFGKGSTDYKPTLVITTTNATLYTATFNETNSLTPSITIYTDADRTETISNGVLLDGTTYYYKAILTGYFDYTGSFTVSGANPSVDFTMTAKSTFTYTKRAVCGSDVLNASLATKTDYEGETITLSWSKYIKVGGLWYVATESTYQSSSTVSATEDVEYSLSNIADFYEMESLTRSGGVYLTETSGSYSGGSRLRLSKGSLYYTPALTGGVYTLSIPWENGNETVNEVYVYTRSAGGVLSEKLKTFTANKGSGTFTYVITVPDGYSIAFNGNEGSANNNARMDYMTLSRLVPTTLGTNGYATFASPYPLDMTSANMPEGLTAYKASVSGTTVTFTELNQTVPANTGVLLQGEAGESYNIPVVASGTAVTENAFLVNEGGTTFTGDDNYYYFGLKKNTLTFGTFDPSSVAIPASKAYLKVLRSSIDTSAAARLSIIFNDETTGVVDVRSKMADVRGGYYNLSGQRVNQPQKGLYIVNGKKVIVK